MCWTFVKWITEIITVIIPINRDQIQNLTSYLSRYQGNMRQYISVSVTVWMQGCAVYAREGEEFTKL
jgi:hypothetical protein